MDATDKEYERRKARAEQQAALEDELPRLPRRIRKAQRRSGAKRLKALAAIAAKIQADRAPHNMTLGCFLRLKPELRRDIRLRGARLEAPKAKKGHADSKEAQIARGLAKLLSEWPTLKDKVTTTDFFEKLYGEHKRFFPEGLPYVSKSTMLRKVRLELARVRPRKRRADP